MCICVFTNKTGSLTEKTHKRQLQRWKNLCTIENHLMRICVFVCKLTKLKPQSLSWGFSEIEIFSRITLVRREFSWESMRPNFMRSWDQQDLPVEIMLNCPKCTRTTNNPTNNPTTCVDEIRSVTFNKVLHRERKENTINTHRLEIQKVIVFFKFSGSLPT